MLRELRQAGDLPRRWNHCLLRAKMPCSLSVPAVFPGKN